MCDLIRPSVAKEGTLEQEVFFVFILAFFNRDFLCVCICVCFRVSICVGV